jgi:hypothetical protein
VIFMPNPKKPDLRIVKDDIAPDTTENSLGLSLRSHVSFNENEDDSDSGGESGGSGSTSPIIDPTLFGLTNHFLLEQIRKGEALFGHVPFTEDPTKKNKPEGQLGKGLPSHPLFRETQQFSGISDNKNNPSPAENSEAAERMQEKLENRLQNRLTQQNQPKISPSIPRLTP